ncbi:zinc finger, RING/FYVE/PHD-type [Artemisia annua]|uniref:Zinc finger, RING/FYVE/PHD-type n=1 Tax=Artemisia annua TaxID=35608 RepID=A0A2U1L8N7_ARTAN|nr:zinc finger, RING/FYVE/PHD-type [Artemisia annua]
MEGAPNVYHHLPAYHRHHNLNCALLFRVPRHNQNVQHSQRNLGHNSGTSTSQGKTNPPLKFSYQPQPGSGYTERRENATRRPAIIRSNNSALVINVVSANAMKMLCGLCSVSTSDLCVAAVLVCGHVFHADCLETETPCADRRDPPCPLCVSSHSVD